METENLIENSRSKLERKSLDLICANSLRTEGAGFKGDTNIITIITKDSITELGKLSKLETAQRIIDVASQMHMVREERSK
jgi:phosphopantothenoylcysteine decarboxylase/phosphopantothenate--cysteine ligase